MTHVGPSSLTNGGLGLFATKSYEEGDVILEEAPMIVLAPSESSISIRIRFFAISRSRRIMVNSSTDPQNFVNKVGC